MKPRTAAVGKAGGAVVGSARGGASARTTAAQRPRRYTETRLQGDATTELATAGDSSCAESAGGRCREEKKELQAEGLTDETTRRLPRLSSGGAAVSEPGQEGEAESSGSRWWVMTVLAETAETGAMASPLPGGGCRKGCDLWWWWLWQNGRGRGWGSQWCKGVAMVVMR